MLTKDELETPRTAAEMLGWVESAISRFNTRELKAAAREGKYFAKELTEEALPIALFARRFYEASPDVTISHTLGNQQYDATVEDRRQTPAPVRYIEVTLSDHDYTESLRMEILSRDGSVAAYGPVRAKGAKGRRMFLEAESIAVNHDDIREKHVAAVVEAVKRKANKEYREGTALVVRIDDYTPFRSDDDLAALDRVARERLVPLLSGREFCVLSLDGSRAAHLAYNL